MRSHLLALCATGLLLVPTTALAHPDIDRGVQAADEGEYETALEAFSAAEQATNVTRDELINLLLSRILVHHALGSTAELGTDLDRLASLEPNYTMGPRFPPDVKNAFLSAKRRVSAPLSVDARARREEDNSVAVLAIANGDVAGLVRETRLYARVGREPWEEGTTSLTLNVSEDEMVQYYAVLVGPGGAIIARDGSATDPIEFTRNAPSPGEAAMGGVREEDEGGLSTGAWVAIIGGAALVIGAVIVAILLTQDDGQVTIGMPCVDGFSPCGN